MFDIRAKRSTEADVGDEDIIITSLVCICCLIELRFGVGPKLLALLQQFLLIGRVDQLISQGFRVVEWFRGNPLIQVRPKIGTHEIGFVELRELVIPICVRVDPIKNDIRVDIQRMSLGVKSDINQTCA